MFIMGTKCTAEVFSAVIGSFVEVLQRIAEICGDDESAPKLRRNMTKSWLAKFPKLTVGVFLRPISVQY